LVVVFLFFVLPRILYKLFYFGPASPVVRVLRPSPWVRFWPVVGPIVGFGGVSAFPPAQPYHFCEGVAGGEKCFFARRAPEKSGAAAPPVLQRRRSRRTIGVFGR